MQLTDIVVIGLAAWRMTIMLSYESGPARIFTRMREGLGFEHDDEGHPTTWPDGGVAEAVACPWCLGLWISAACWLIYEFCGDVGRAFIAVMSIAASLIIAHHIVMRLKNG